MTPDEAISAAFRAASREMSQGMTEHTAAAYEGFLVQTQQTLRESARALGMIAEHRPGAHRVEIARLEMHAYNQILQTTIGCLMALGHFPYLGEIESTVVHEKLC